MSRANRSRPDALPPPDVVVSKLVQDKISDSQVFTGRVQSMHDTAIKARVTGHLVAIHFKEGEDVEAGADLFDLDATPYQAVRDQAAASLNQAVAMVAQADAHYKSADDTYQRDVAAPQATPLATQIQDRDARDEAMASYKAAQATAKAAEATLHAAQINVDFCHIKAPFSGRISRLNVDLNNDILADNTTLASLVQLQPKIYAYFDVDERSLLGLMVVKKESGETAKDSYLPHGKVSVEAVKNLHLTLGLANEDPQQFSHKGELAFATNALDASTGTLRLWGTFDNAAMDLEPNLFARVRVDIGDPHPAYFVSEAALGSDQEFRYLYVVNDKGEAEYARVEVGPKHDGLVAVTPSPMFDKDGKLLPPRKFTPETVVVVDGLQRIHPVLDEKTAKPKPVKVNGKMVEMPRAAAAQ